MKIPPHRKRSSFACLNEHVIIYSPKESTAETFLQTKHEYRFLSLVILCQLNATVISATSSIPIVRCLPVFLSRAMASRYSSSMDELFFRFFAERQACIHFFNGSQRIFALNPHSLVLRMAFFNLKWPVAKEDFTSQAVKHAPTAVSILPFFKEYTRPSMLKPQHSHVPRRLQPKRTPLETGSGPVRTSPSHQLYRPMSREVVLQEVLERGDFQTGSDSRVIEGNWTSCGQLD